MLGAELIGFARWVQRVGGQQKTLDQPRFLRAKYACLTASVGMAAEENPASNQLPDSSHGRFQALAVSRRLAGSRRTKGAELPEGQVATQYRHPRIGKSLGQSHQQRTLAVSSRAMREHQGIVRWLHRAMQEPAD